MEQDTYNAAVAAGLFCKREVVAGITLIAYDYLLMFPKEQLYIWGWKWTPGKVLYLLVRYFPIFDIILVAIPSLCGKPFSCQFTTISEMTGAVIACFLADIVYSLRTWALWDRNTFVGCGIILCGLAFNISAVVILLAQQPELEFMNIPGYLYCFLPPSRWAGVWTAYLLTTCFQLVLLLATLVRKTRQVTTRPSDLTTVLYRDALYSFVGQVCMGLVNVTLQITLVDMDYSMDMTFTALLSIMPSRIILNMREAATQGSESDLDGWDITRCLSAHEASPRGVVVAIERVLIPDEQWCAEEEL